MPDPLAQLEPRALWSRFAEIASIPRPSKHEERIADWALSLARRQGFEARRDGAGNVVIAAPATRGRETAPPVVLQSHLDMVCEKNRDVEHDFLRDPIRPWVDGDWVRARGTTLGADNGIGVAACFAAATDPSLAHGPLELLLTLDEETGLTGAANLDPGLVRGRTLLNLDSEDDGVLFIGCAGGMDSILTLDIRLVEPPPGAAAYRLEVAGLRGGHSGIQIHENRGNAIQLLARVLCAALDSGISLGLGSLRGGSKHNAIPREAEATVHLPRAARERFEELLASALESFRTELRGTDDALRLTLTPLSDAGHTFAEPDRDRLLRLLMALPHGVLAMSAAVPGLVETSSNLAVVEADGSAGRVVTSSRSSVSSSLRHVVRAIRATSELAGAGADTANGYPGWQPNLGSPVLAVVRDVYRRRWGREPTITAVHAGLECGLLAEKVPGIDMVSFGPQIVGAHSPDEKVQISSVHRFWEALKEVLDLLSREPWIAA